MGYYIGLDLGGTNIKYGVVDDKARIISKGSCVTPVTNDPAVLTGGLVAAAHEAVRLAGLSLGQIDYIGIGSPGMLNLKEGKVIAAPNIPALRNVLLAPDIARQTGRPAILENDANAAGFGEFWAGAGRDPSIRNLVMLTLGTGVGSGIVIDGKVLHGAYDLAGEMGHLIVVPNGRLCACGQRGCLEAYASASSTARRAVEALTAGEKSKLSAIFSQGVDKITTKEIFEAAKEGDALAVRVIEETTTLLGIACVSICRVLDPQMIVFAGGMILAGPYLFDRVRAAFTDHSWKMVPTKMQIVPAQLGNDAGFIGAAAVAWEAHQSGSGSAA
ncbi:MAG: ROK family protein [Phycisphaeraceae bacterium]|nr:ROK family protein [Phycisphaeraceae bacterium]